MLNKIETKRIFINMEDQKFIDFVTEKVGELHTQRLNNEDKARIDKIFERNFIPTLFDFLERSTENKVAFTREIITKEDSDYDLLQEMNDTLIVEIYYKGYKFIEEESTPDTLVFQRR